MSIDKSQKESKALGCLEVSFSFLATGKRTNLGNVNENTVLFLMVK
jgi:hypothetical protein